MIDSSRLKANAAKVFSRFLSPAQTNTILFDELGQDQTRALPDGAFVFAEEELPILAFVDVVHTRWAIITTHRVIWGRASVDGSVEFDDIDRVVSPSVDDRGDSGTDDKLAIYDKHGNRYVVELEPGLPLGGFWNVALTLKRAWARSRQT